MEDIAIIIPIHEYNETIEKLLIRAINSVPKKSDVRISCKNGLSDKFDTLKSIDDVNITIYENHNNDSKSDFCSLVNQAVGGTKWFTILEFDDEYTPIWFNNVEKYIQYKPEVSVFMPLEDLYDFNTNEYIGIRNEAPWASSFSNEVGYIDYDCLESYFDFYLTGAVFNTEDWIEIGGFKPSIKLTFWYEFLLRLTNLGKKVYIIPKVGYNHYVNRENSLYDIYKKTISDDEGSYWFNKAKELYTTKEDKPCE